MRHAVHVVARAERAVGVHQELRHDEQRDALHAFGRVRRAREHEVDDVLGHVVLAVGDEDLGAEELVGAVALRLGARAHQRRGRSRPAARSGSSCRSTRPRPSSAGSVVLQLVASRAAASASIAPSVSSGHSAKLMLALFHISLHGVADRACGRPWPPNSAGCCSALPAAFAELAERLLEARRRRDLAVLPRRAACWSPARFSGASTSSLNFARFLEHRLDRVGRRLLEAGQLRDLRRGRRARSCTNSMSLQRGA